MASVNEQSVQYSSSHAHTRDTSEELGESINRLNDYLIGPWSLSGPIHTDAAAVFSWTAHYKATTK